MTGVQVALLLVLVLLWLSAWRLHVLARREREERDRSAPMDYRPPTIHELRRAQRTPPRLRVVRGGRGR